jgi:serine/threonine protein kinase/Tfp pilus assembly protein PilF
MGVVYLAHDTKLDRQVAIKSLPGELMDNHKARSRFSREARVLASLNHPNIATIYEELKEAEGAGFLVLEYVPGDTLAERIGRKKLKVEEALTIGLQIAEAVAAAHEKGVIHRDLKAGNIKITPEGKVKVLDFGLAKAVGGETLNQQSTITEPGRIIGTPAYMSPEQARGEQTDERSDIWSFGCVLYEMLTGRVPFEGGTPSDTLANILQSSPDWQVLPQNTPANIQVLLRRCLEKDPHRRLQHMGDASIEISETLNLLATAPAVTIPEKLRRIGMIVAVIAIITVCGVAVWFMLQRKSQPSSKLIRLVVLPFENLGPAEDEYFADGITDAITARLGGIRELGVISRQSAMQYKKTEKSAQQIGNELRVSYILEGTIQREQPSDPNSRVRIIPQLIRVSDDTHVWAQPYDDDMSGVFRVQSDVAEHVAQALDITLLEPERQALASRPTENMEAYNYFLLGGQYLYRSFLENDFRIAIQMYDKAVDLDPTFALAYTQLSRAHLFIYWHHPDKCEGCLVKAKQAVDKAFQLNPELPEAHLALGHYYYHGHLDYDRALEQFAIARKSQPNNSHILSYIAYVQRRQGKFEQAVAAIKEASELDPRFRTLPYVIGETLLLMRKYQEAEHYFDRAISLAPDWPRPYAWKMQLYLLWEGDREKAGAVLEQALKNIGSMEDSFITLGTVRLNMFDRTYPEALEQLSSWKSEAFTTQFYFIPTAQLYAQINGLMGNSQLEQTYYNSARDLLESKIKKHPEDGRLHSSLGVVYAGLGRKEDAIRIGKRGAELLPVTKEAYKGTFRIDNLARIYVMVGKLDQAIDKLEFLLSIPSELTVSSLRLDPVWDPLRDHPRFKKLLEEGK